MISGEKIAQLIQSPSKVVEVSSIDLQSLKDNYPYCSSLHLLYLKSLALNNDLNFENELGKAAVHVPDRAHLYALIHSDPSQLLSEDESLPKPELQKLEPETKVVAQEDELPTSTIPSTASEILAEAKELEENEEFIDHSLDESILTNAIDIAYIHSGIDAVDAEQNFTEELKNEEDEEIRTKKSIETANKKAFNELEEEALTQDKKEENISLDIREKNEEPLSFVSWLKAKQNQGNQEFSAQDDEIFEETIEKGRRKDVVNELLEKFIAEQPTISRPVKDFYNPAKNARDSIEESEDMVTETLAKIYALQKNYAKAISAYEKLILLYPEKKTFFASRIEKLREEQKKR